MRPRHRLELFCATILLTLAASLHAQEAEKKSDEAPTRRYLYMSSPDGAQSEGRSGVGVLIFDIDDGHRFVRRIEVKSFEEGLRGFTPNAKSHSAYFSTTNRRLGCLDLETDQVRWEKVYDAGCDRSSVTPDGTKVFVPTGWWYAGEDSGFLVVDARTGDLLRKIPVGPAAHNSIASLDGRHVYLGTTTTLTVFDARTEKVVRQIRDVGERGVFPYTINHAQTRAYVCLGAHVGFDVVDLSAGKRIARVLAGHKPIAHRTHGAGLTPDGTELWISDQVGKRLFIFAVESDDAAPLPKGHVELSIGGHGWVTFSLDGAYAWSHAPDVFDARSKKKLTTLRDEKGEPFASSKFFEAQFRDGKVVAVGSEFGLGRR